MNHTLPIRTRFKRTRLLIGRIRSLLHGWSFLWANPNKRLINLDEWHCIADYPTIIKSRPELGEQNQNRIHNMKISCQMINGLILSPGRIFSMQKVLGEPTAGRGYRFGPAIIRGRLQTDLGGGLCQISTALFNVALLADLEILEKYNHSADIWGENRAFALGRDASFAYARHDLKFRNPHAHDVCLYLAVDDASHILMSRIWAPQPLPYAVEVSTKILASSQPDPVPDGTEYCRAWVVETTRLCGTQPNVRVTYRAISRYQPARMAHGLQSDIRKLES